MMYDHVQQYPFKVLLVKTMETKHIDAISWQIIRITQYIILLYTVMCYLNAFVSNPPPYLVNLYARNLFVSVCLTTFNTQRYNCLALVQSEVHLTRGELETPSKRR